MNVTRRRRRVLRRRSVVVPVENALDKNNRVPSVQIKLF